MTYTPPPTNYYQQPQQWPPPQPPKKKRNPLVLLLAIFGGFIILSAAVAAIDSGSSDPKPASQAKSAVADNAAPTSTGPRDTITFNDGLTATITGVTTGTSTNRFDHDGPITIVSVELRNVGTKTLDAADWWAPYLNYGPRGMVAEEASVAGTVNGLRSDYKGSGLLPPGGVVTVNSSYEVALADMSPATITPRWPGRQLWSGDFAAAFGTP